MSAFENRFDHLSRTAARLLLAALVVLVSYGLASPPAPAHRVKDPRDTLKIDQNLYTTVVTHVAAGEDYYAAAAREHRARGYPMVPFVTVRPPALARFTAAIGGSAPALVLLQVLAVLATIIFTLRVFTLTQSRNLTVAVAAATSFAVAGSSQLFQMHEAWAGMLIIIGLAVWHRSRWPLAVPCFFLAVLVRELAAPVLLVMIAMALYERRWREAMAWGATTVAFAATLAVHAQHVAAVQRVGDLQSPGWTAAGGWPFVLRMVNDATAFVVLPLWSCAVLVPLALLGWASWRHGIAARATLYLVGMIGAFTIVGRANNNYWALLLGPILPIGLAFAPAALVTLLRRAGFMPDRRAPVT